MSGRHRSHTWDHLLLAKFYNQRVSGQRSINNTSIYQAALRGESIQSSHLVPLPPSRRNTHLGCWAGQPPSSCSLALPSGQKGTGSPKGLALIGDLSTLHFSVLGRNWGGAGRKRNVPPPSIRHVLEDPRAQLLP